MRKSNGAGAIVARVALALQTRRISAIVVLALTLIAVGLVPASAASAADARVVKLGLALPQSVNAPAALGAAVDRQNLRPDVVAVWSRGLVMPVDFVASAIVEQRKDVLYYATTHGMDDADILAGDHDETIDAFARRLSVMDGSPIVRLNQEPNGGFGAPWTEKQGTTPQKYKAAFRYVSKQIRAIAPRVRMAFAIAWRGDNGDFAKFWPGREAAQVAAVDTYWRFPGTMPGRMKVIRRVLRQTSDAPIWITETGIHRGVPGRAHWLKSAKYVKGIEGIVVMNMDLWRATCGASTSGPRWRSGL